MSVRPLLSIFFSIIVNYSVLFSSFPLMWLDSAPGAILQMVTQTVRLLQLGAARPGLSTNAQWVRDLKESNRLHPDQHLNHFLRSNKLSVWPTATVPSFPQVGAGEALRCQPFVTARLEELHACLLNRTMYKYKRGLANLMRRQKTDVVFTSTASDSHTVVSFENHKPDVVCFAGDEVGPSSIAFLGDVKDCTSATNGFTDEEVGHVLDMATVLMIKHQFHRSTLLCFLTDGLRFQFFRLVRPLRSSEILYESSAVFVREHGWQVRDHASTIVPLAMHRVEYVYMCVVDLLRSADGSRGGSGVHLGGSARLQGRSRAGLRSLL